MKRLFLSVLLSSFVFLSYAQNNLGSADDAARIALTPYVDADLGFNREVSKQLTNKMNAILTKQGLAGSRNQRFIITANASVLSEDIVVTTTEMYQYELEVSFIIGDGIEGTKFAMASQTVQGLGETKADAYLKAIRKIKPTDPALQSMVNEAKNKIIEYYNAKCDFIITEAKSYATRQEYDAAIYKLMSVPDVCKDCYDKCMAAATEVYQMKIDEEGNRILAEARALWNARKDAETARQAGLILVQINPASRAYKGAVVFSKEIETYFNTVHQRKLDTQERDYQRTVEKEDRAWEFKLQEQQNEVELQRANINAMRDVGVAYGENQQPVTYNTGGWWGNLKAKMKNIFQ